MTSFIACTPKAYGPLGNVDSMDGMPMEPGKCYAKCKSPVVYENIVEDRVLYTGEPIEADYLEHISQEIRPAGTKWIKKKTENCLSANPDDCLIWCLSTVPAETEEYILVKDTTQTSEYKVETVEYRKPVSFGGEIEWQEVICQNKIDKGLVQDIATVLIDEGFYSDNKIPSKLNMQLTKAMVEYQKEYGLYSGQMTMETLNHMKIQH